MGNDELIKDIPNLHAFSPCSKEGVSENADWEKKAKREVVMSRIAVVALAVLAAACLVATAALIASSITAVVLLPLGASFMPFSIAALFVTLVVSSIAVNLFIEAYKGNRATIYGDSKIAQRISAALTQGTLKDFLSHGKLSGRCDDVISSKFWRGLNTFFYLSKPQSLTGLKLVKDYQKATRALKILEKKQGEQAQRGEVAQMAIAKKKAELAAALAALEEKWQLFQKEIVTQLPYPAKD